MLNRLLEIGESALPKLLSQEDEDALYQAKTQTWMTVCKAFQIGKAIFTIWHSALWASANAYIEEPPERFQDSLTCFRAQPPTQNALSYIPRMSQEERVDEWLDDLETFDHPEHKTVMGYHELAILVAELEKDLDWLHARIDRILERNSGEEIRPDNTGGMGPEWIISDESEQSQLDSDSSSVISTTSSSSSRPSSVL